MLRPRPQSAGSAAPVEEDQPVVADSGEAMPPWLYGCRCRTGGAGRHREPQGEGKPRRMAPRPPRARPRRRGARTPGSPGAPAASARAARRTRHQPAPRVAEAGRAVDRTGTGMAADGANRNSSAGPVGQLGRRGARTASPRHKSPKRNASMNRAGTDAGRPGRSVWPGGHGSIRAARYAHRQPALRVAETGRSAEPGRNRLGHGAGEREGPPGPADQSGQHGTRATSPHLQSPKRGAPSTGPEPAWRGAGDREGPAGTLDQGGTVRASPAHASSRRSGALR